MKRLSAIASLSAVPFMLSACAAIPLQPGAERVRVTHVEPGAECRFLGDTTASQGNVFTGGYTTNANLETGARNDLKNKAAAMGGNLVVLLTQRGASSGGFGESGGSISQTNVTYSGNVYSCPISAPASSQTSPEKDATSST